MFYPVLCVYFYTSLNSVMLLVLVDTCPTVSIWLPLLAAHALGQQNNSLFFDSLNCGLCLQRPTSSFLMYLGLY